jgi:REP element-mobilizing transposase RayT
MEIRRSAHDAYHHAYHLVWIPKYRRRVLKGPLKDFRAQQRGESREIRHRVPEIKKGDWWHEFRSVGFFSSTVGSDLDSAVDQHLRILGVALSRSCRIAASHMLYPRSWERNDLPTGSSETLAGIGFFGIT